MEHLHASRWSSSLAHGAIELLSLGLQKDRYDRHIEVSTIDGCYDGEVEPAK